MKKIVLSGVVLILLIILAVDLYNDHEREINQKNSLHAAATLPANANTASINDNIARDLSDDIAPATEAQGVVATVATNKHRHHRLSRVTPIDESLVSNGSEDDDDLDGDNPYGLVVISDDQDPDITVETPKDYLGNLPDKPKPMPAEHRHTVHFGLEGGYMENSFYNNSSPKMCSEGFFAGGLVDIGLGNHFALQPGLRYEMKGIQVENNTTTATMNVDTKDRIDLSYLEVPVDLVVKFGDWHDARFIVGAGPYISYLLSANDKYNTTTTVFANPVNPASRTTAASTTSSPDGVTEEAGNRNLPIGNSSNGTGSVRSLDWGVNGFIGVETPGGFNVKAGTEVGLRNIQQNTDGSYSSRNYNYFVSVGYLFGFKR